MSRFIASDKSVIDASKDIFPALEGRNFSLMIDTSGNSLMSLSFLSEKYNVTFISSFLCVEKFIENPAVKVDLEKIDQRKLVIFVYCYNKRKRNFVYVWRIHVLHSDSALHKA